MTTPHTTERAAILLAAATPFLMIGSRGIAPVVLAAVVALLALASWRTGRREQVVDLLQAGVAGLVGAFTLAFAALLVASLAWTPALPRGAEHAAHTVGSLGLLALALANVRVLAPGVPARGLAAALVATGLIVVLDLQAGGGVRGAFGFSTDLFRLNRAAVALCLLLPLATALLLAERRRLWAGAAWLSSAVAIFSSQSASAQLGLLVVLVTSAIAMAAPRAANRLVAGVAILATLCVPLLAPIANDLVPSAVHEAVGYGSLTIRGEIWREYASLLEARPLFGFGIEASHVAPSLPEAAVLTDAQRDLLSWGHPHNAALQLWFELGAVGAVVASALMALLFRAIERHAGPLLPYASATAAGAYAMAFVSHGAWQAWWLCLLALVATLFAAARAAPTTPARSGTRESSAVV